ncbi:[FeFe] hydrogenase H-cluster maturation GTPase HydF [bacterium 1XD42-1]|nr:[FeFe] hydrogenase H-cluster maturation GTPase HydF [bacterium 1XD42-8]RKJ64736.1 [FeFe] hydrogenase H-cluster maturation GTPase HydF [bacterium 1XD42-1]
MNSLNETPRANRLHIAIFGRRNSGKSTLINALTGHETSVTSPVAGTTTDPVYKSMEISGIGPCVLIDTAGFDDEGELGTLRIARTQDAMEKTDIAVIVCSTEDFTLEAQWGEALRKKKCSIIPVINKTDLYNGIDLLAEKAEKIFNAKPVCVSALKKEGMEALLEALRRAIPPDWENPDLTDGLAKKGDSVLLAMPQDIQAPKGRLILPQVQTIRSLLDKGCIVTSVTADQLEEGLASFKEPPDLIITDSQVFPLVWAKKPSESRLTSFSILMARNKGDIHTFLEGAKAIDRLTEHSKVLVAEACTHAPLSEDIGREKIPRLLRKKAGQGLQIDMVSGPDFPENLAQYDLIIHCGACMFNRKYVLSRLEKAVAAGVPITNYGVALAKLSGILEQISNII